MWAVSKRLRATVQVSNGLSGSCSSFRRCASAVAVPTASSPDTANQDIWRESSLPNPDPSKDSSTARLVADHAQYLVATYVKPPPVMVKGEGSWIWDMENRRYLDFTAGIAVNAFGHCDPEIAKLLSQQATTLVHCSNLYHNAWAGEFAKLLVENTRESGAMPGAARVFVSNSGSEANEAAIKFVRKVGKQRDPSSRKVDIVSFQNSFHGRTMGALSATPTPKYQKPFGPMVPGFRCGEFNNSDGNYLKDLISEETCGVIVEPIQGEGGVNVATPEFLKALRKRVDEVGAVLIFDEIQCGLGRTGHLWAHSATKVYPDIMTTAKALGNGFPIGAVIVTDEVAKHMVTGDHGTTFGGNPLACRLAHSIVSRLSGDEFLSEVARKGELFRQGLESLMAKHASVCKEIRGRGLILGLQLNTDPTPIITAARERGLLTITGGVNTLRFVPPLIISDEQISQGLAILDDAMQAVLGGDEKPEPTKGQQEMAPQGR